MTAAARTAGTDACGASLTLVTSPHLAGHRRGSLLNFLMSGEDQSKCLTWIGVCHRRLGHTEEAFQYLHLAVDFQQYYFSRPHESYFHLARSYQMDNQHVATARWWAKVLEHSPNNILRAEDIKTLASLLRIVSHWRLAFWRVLITSRSILNTNCTWSWRGRWKKYQRKAAERKPRSNGRRQQKYRASPIEELRQDYRTERTRPIVKDMPHTQHEHEVLLEELEKM